MSNFYRITKHPESGQRLPAQWIDDHFGPHRYGIKFSDGKIFTESDIQAVEDPNPIGAEASHSKTIFYFWDESAVIRSRDKT